MSFVKETMPGLVLATAMSGVICAGGLAQDSASNVAEKREDVIVVTGSQIQGAKIDDVLPVTVLDEEAIETSGAVSGDELFRSIPQSGSVAFNDQSTVGGVNGARGDIASINLRALGTGNTLLLVNGRRMVLNPGFQTELLVPVVSPDTNTIPPGGVGRVEVLRDGASAVYGADAVAGVVNTHLKGGLDGGFLRANYRSSTGTSLSSPSIRGGYGFDFNQGRSNLTLYGYYFNENGAPASIRDYSTSSDRRSFFEGSDFAGDTQLDNRSNDTPWGEFDIQSSNGNTDLNDDDFHIQPCSVFGDAGTPSDGRFLDLGGGLCADNGTTIDRSLRYDLAGDRDLFSRKDRYNAYLLLNHELNDSVEFYLEGSFYRTESNRSLEQRSNLTTTPIGVLPTAFYNPFGATTNPNRLTNGIAGIPTSGAAVQIEDYRPVDAGPRDITVTKDSFRFVAGFKGDFRAWDFDTGFVYSEAKTTDLTRNRVSISALQDAINRTDATAYNPFNGACLLTGSPNVGDCTPSNQAALDSIRIDVSRTGTTSLALADLRVSRPDVFGIPGGDVGLAAGIEWRNESFSDDRDPRLDGSFTFTNAVSGASFGSDVLGSSPSPDTNGSRHVFSGFAEALVPLVSGDMNIPLVRELNVQLAGRIEHFDDIGETAIVPRIAASWTLVPAVLVRGAWSRGFRAPNLVQVNDLGTQRSNTRDDLVRCQAEVEKDMIANLGACSGDGVVSLRTGTNELKPEDTESINLGIVIAPGALPGLTITADYWRVRQDGIVGVFGDQNAIALDLLRRLNGSTNPNVVRENPDAGQMALYAGTSLAGAAAGDIIRVNDPYRNFDSRTSSGWDFGVFYEVPDFAFGELRLQVNAAFLESFFQTPGSEGQELLDAIESGVLPGSISIANIGELLELDGRPRWRFSGAVNWSSGPVAASVFGRYVGDVLDTSVTQDASGPNPGANLPVGDWFVVSGSVSYTIENNSSLDGLRLKARLNNILDSAPPIADQSFGFFSNLHSARGRQIIVEIQKAF